MKVLVCGGRDFCDATVIYDELDRVHARYVLDTMIEGDARGRRPNCR